MKKEAAYIRKLKKKEMDPSKDKKSQQWGVFSKKDKLMGRFPDQIAAEKHRRLVTMMGFIQRGSLDPKVESEFLDAVSELMLDGVDYDEAFDLMYDEFEKSGTYFFPDDPVYWAKEDKKEDKKKKKKKDAQFDPHPELLDMVDVEEDSFYGDEADDVESGLAQFFVGSAEFREDLEYLMESRGESPEESVESIVGLLREQAVQYFSGLLPEYEEQMLEKLEVVDLNSVAELIAETL